MSRRIIRTRTLSLDISQRLAKLFGTVQNAHRQLGLEGELHYQHFYRAMQLNTVRPDQLDLIEAAWERWQELYLRPEVPEADNLAITPINRDTLPEWHPGFIVTAEPKRKHG